MRDWGLTGATTMCLKRAKDASAVNVGGGLQACVPLMAAQTVGARRRKDGHAEDEAAQTMPGRPRKKREDTRANTVAVWADIWAGNGSLRTPQSICTGPLGWGSAVLSVRTKMDQRSVWVGPLEMPLQKISRLCTFILLPNYIYIFQNQCTMYTNIHGIIKVNPDLVVPMFCFKGDQSIHLEETIYIYYKFIINHMQGK
jgi:hypothetical protein